MNPTSQPSSTFSQADQAKFDAILQAHSYVAPATPGDSAPAKNWRSLVKTPSAPAQPALGARIGADISGAGKDVASTIAGEGEHAGEPDITRGAEAAATAFHTPLKVASELLPDSVRKGIGAVGDAAGGIVGWLGDKIGSTKAAQDFVVQHPDAAKALENIAKTTGAFGSIAGDILTEGGGAAAGDKLASTASDTADAVKGVNAVADQMKAPEPINTNDILPESGKMTPEEAHAAAWKDIQPEATDKNVEAYRAQGATNPKTLTKGVTLNPTKADQQVLEHIRPLYEDGSIKPGMSTEEKVSAIGGKSREVTLQSDNFIADHNKIVETPEIRSALDAAKKGSEVVFGTDKTLEGAYDAVSNAFKGKLDSGTAGATGTDLASLRDALKSFDAEMTDKFPNVYKTSPTGEINPTDNARITAIRDVHTAVRDFIVKKLNEDGTAGDLYKSLLEKNSGYIKAAKMLNENASNASKIESFLKLLKAHPYFSGLAGWEALKHTVAPGLPGL